MEEEDTEEDEDEEKESDNSLKDAEKIYNEALKKNNKPVSPIKEAKTTNESLPLTNGNSKHKDEQKPLFVMWKKQEEEESEKDDSDQDIDERVRTPPPSAPGGKEALCRLAKMSPRARLAFSSAQ